MKMDTFEEWIPAGVYPVPRHGTGMTKRQHTLDLFIINKGVLLEHIIEIFKSDFNL